MESSVWMRRQAAGVGWGSGPCPALPCPLAGGLLTCYSLSLCFPISKMGITITALKSCHEAQVGWYVNAQLDLWSLMAV